MVAGAIKFLTNSGGGNPWVLTQKYFRDKQLDFTYRIIHKKNDTGYLSGNLSAALCEFRVFDDSESLRYFLALLVQSKVLVPVDIAIRINKPVDKLRENDVITFTDVALYAVWLQNKQKNPTKIYYPIFTSVRQLVHSPLPKSETYLYLPFDDVLTWLQRDNDVTHVLLDHGGPNGTICKLDDFLRNIVFMQLEIAQYGGHEILRCARQACLKKHLTKNCKHGMSHNAKK